MSQIKQRFSSSILPRTKPKKWTVRICSAVASNAMVCPQRLPYEDALPPPADVTTPSDFAGFEVPRVIRSWCASRERAVIPTKEVRGPFHPDRLMRPFHVIAVNELVELLLLRSE